MARAALAVHSSQVYCWSPLMMPGTFKLLSGCYHVTDATGTDSTATVTRMMPPGPGAGPAGAFPNHA
jgi:hypothetical protein